MVIDRKQVARKLAAYLHHEITLAELVDWAERTMMDAEFPEAELPVARDVVGRLGLADVRSFRLAWEDCEEMLQELGFSVRLDIVAK